MVKGWLHSLVGIALVLTVCFGWTAPTWAGLGNLPRNEGKALTTKEMRDLVGGGLTGNYDEDVKKLVGSLRNALNLDNSDPGKKDAQADAKYKINAFASRYRRPPYEGLESFTTLRTALNTLASYYNSTARRSVPQKVKDRVFMELDRAEKALAEGL